MCVVFTSSMIPLFVPNHIYNIQCTLTAVSAVSLVFVPILMLLRYELGQPKNGLGFRKL